MNLDEAQKQKVRQWIEEGQKLSQIQSLFEKEFGLKMTYMEARFLVDDLKLSPKDPTPPPKPVVPETPAKPIDAHKDATNGGDIPAGAGKVSLSVDTIPRPGSLVSGNVIFSDGVSATWLLDQTGRLGLSPKTPGYRPPAQDVEEFQILLQEELSKLGV